MQSQQFRGVWRNNLKGFDRNLYIALYEERSRLWNVYASRNRYCLNEANERSWSILVFIVIRLGIELEPPSSVSRIHPVRDVIMAAYLVAVSGKLEFFFFFQKVCFWIQHFLCLIICVTLDHAPKVPCCGLASKVTGLWLLFSFRKTENDDFPWWWSDIEVPSVVPIKLSPEKSGFLWGRPGCLITLCSCCRATKRPPTCF